MAEGTDNVEDHLSCDDSSYSKRNLEVYDSGDGVNSGSEEYDGGNTDALGKEPYQFKPTGTDWTTLRLCILLLLVPIMVLTLCNLRWCSFLVDPIVYAHIQISMFCVVVVVCGVPCVCMCACSRSALTVMCVCVVFDLHCVVVEAVCACVCVCVCVSVRVTVCV